jgi:hypothetical protein
MAPISGALTGKGARSLSDFPLRFAGWHSEPMAKEIDPIRAKSAGASLVLKR